MLCDIFLVLDCQGKIHSIPGDTRENNDIPESRTDVYGTSTLQSILLTLISCLQAYHRRRPSWLDSCLLDGTVRRKRPHHRQAWHQNFQRSSRWSSCSNSGAVR
ncbi:hypothetical protein MPH_12044 [Macrophomina phaseolina MS6]|uniref:Uncharacterized protein n=1 Tax=Macrophomina phaseolina (strain MS6) TaxID=1126212 RepID=K2QMH9_MACPH|nr:hypothetical protein MPH_12044 [Macrophomina phaseolina MS6]